MPLSLCLRSVYAGPPPLALFCSFLPLLHSEGKKMISSSSVLERRAPTPTHPSSVTCASVHSLETVKKYLPPSPSERAAGPAQRTPRTSSLSLPFALDICFFFCHLPSFHLGRECTLPSSHSWAQKLHLYMHASLPFATARHLAKEIQQELAVTLP